MTNREHFIATLQACYFGDRNAFEEIIRIYDEKENIIKEVREYIKDIILCKNKHQKEVPTTTFCDEGVKLIFQFINEDISKILDKENK